MFQNFTISGSSLLLLNQGEKGILSRLSHVDEAIRKELEALGLVKGTPIVLEQRSPQFVVKVGDHRLTLSESLIRNIYVRLAKP